MSVDNPEKFDKKSLELSLSPLLQQSKQAIVNKTVFKTNQKARFSTTVNNFAC